MLAGSSGNAPLKRQSAKWSATKVSPDVDRRLRTAARKGGARPLTHNLFDLGPGDRVQVLVGVHGRQHEGRWIQSKVVAIRTLRMNHPKVVVRRATTPEGVVSLPSSVVVVEDRLPETKSRRDSSYLLCVHDWQAVLVAFYGRKPQARLNSVGTVLPLMATVGVSVRTRGARPLR